MDLKNYDETIDYRECFVKYLKSCQNITSILNNVFKSENNDIKSSVQLFNEHFGLISKIITSNKQPYIYHLRSFNRTSYDIFSQISKVPINLFLVYNSCRHKYVKFGTNLIIYTKSKERFDIYCPEPKLDLTRNQINKVLKLDLCNLYFILSLTSASAYS